MKKVLVAGGAGFIGSHLVDRLLQRIDIEKLVVIDNLWTGLRKNFEHVHDPRFTFCAVDVEAFQSDIRFDEIYHLASPASPPWYMAEPLRTVSANVLGTLRLLELLAPGGRIGYTSTSEVYGDPIVTPQPESYRGSVDCTGPRSSYDESKRCAEAVLSESARVAGTDIRIARLFNTYGPRTRADDGRAVSNFISAALTGKPIVVHGDGRQTRSWGYVKDVVEGLERLFWSVPHAYRSPVNLGNDREIPVIDIAEYVARLVPGARIEFGPPAPQDPSQRRPDLTLARRLLHGWRCHIPYEEGIRATLEWFARGADPADTGREMLLAGRASART